MAPISQTWVLFFSFILVHLLLGFMTTSQPDFLYHQCMGGNYTSNSTFRRNLDSALSSFTSATARNNSGNNSITVGQNPDAAYAIGFCRGDVSPEICRICVNDSVTELRQRCPNRTEAIVYYDVCMLRYSNRSMFNVVDTRPAYYMWNPNNVFSTSEDEFNEALRRLMDAITFQAAGSSRRFAIGNTTVPNYVMIYGLVQCTPDLSSENCRNCLTGAAREIPGCCDRRLGGRVIQPSCNLRYEVDRFYNETPAEETPVVPQAPRSDPGSIAGGGKNTGRTIIIIVIPTAISLILIVCICIFLRKRKLRKPKEKIEIVDEISTVESLQYGFDTINVATDGFSDSNKLGQGGFGAVYKGMLPNGQKIAVKRLSMDSGQGDLEFKNEVLLAAKLQHRNLVRLLGFCLEGTERLLIYEFIQNTSLDHFIFDPVKSPFLDWNKRYKIIAGVARGLLYLHEDSRLRIIHRDLKVSNILLDRDMNPKIADFGMARLFAVDETQCATNRIVGTYGYMAPEYAMHGQFSVKSDVFSFGVLVLEIVSGRKNLCFRDGEMVEDLLSYAWKNWRNGTAENLVDPAIRASTGSLIEIMRCIHIGLLCVQENDTDRPNMASVFLMLNSFSLTLGVPSEPAFFMHSTINPKSSLQLQGDDSRAIRSTYSQTKSLCASVNGDSISEIYPR